jgi:hypothetical protein
MMPTFSWRGRAAWIVAAIFGLIVLITGSVTNKAFLTMVGAGFLILAVVFLILSSVTHGRTNGPSR